MSQLDSDEIVMMISHILAENVEPGVGPVEPDASLSTREIDSLAVILILSSLEERLNITWEIEDFDPAKYQTVRDLADFIVQLRD